MQISKLRETRVRGSARIRPVYPLTGKGRVTSSGIAQSGCRGGPSPPRHSQTQDSWGGQPESHASPPLLISVACTGRDDSPLAPSLHHYLCIYMCLHSCYSKTSTNHQTITDTLSSPVLKSSESLPTSLDGIQLSVVTTADLEHLQFGGHSCHRSHPHPPPPPPPPPHTQGGQHSIHTSPNEPSPSFSITSKHCRDGPHHIQ